MQELIGWIDKFPAYGLSRADVRHKATELLEKEKQQRKDEAIAFAEWLRTRAATGNNGCWEYEDNQDGFLRILTTNELYNEFKKQSK